MNIFEYALMMFVWSAVYYWYIVFPGVFLLGLLMTYFFVIRKYR